MGRDILSRLIHGARLSLFIGLCSVVMALLPGVVLGLLAAFFPKALGSAIMRLMDIMMALPSLLLAVAIMAILGPGLMNAMIAIATVALPAYVRLTRASAMTELNRDYVTASRVAGAGLPRLMFVTVLPNCMAPLIVHATMSFSSAILEIAALGFLGGRAAADPGMGHHAGLGPRLHRKRLVGGDAARPDHSAVGARHQSDGRRTARRAGPETEARRLRG